MIPKTKKIWFVLLTICLFLICFEGFTKPANAEKAPLPEYKYEVQKRQGNSALNYLPEVKPGPDIPGAKKWDKWAMLQVRVLDFHTRAPLPNTEVVLGENGYRVKTDANGRTPAFPAPVIRDPRYTETLARLHGQLTLLSYKNGYRDTIYFNVRMNERILTTVDMYMIRIDPQSRRIEPYVYFYPTHRLFTINLAEQFRSKTQPGAGPESPAR
ncbi:hypothetical protein PP175_22040 [Aneurinibacillus sp. Ricciae_BoGa-3]|uniref:hypothetical protein n=1 Tax=Aneurinibacillus sp. Ricciae_BoGa-3 TaxID=3022697 RepID=UPI002340E6FF|nr:hypothetical protein [Aneurinibacillus sp. Ricciae_BoGa-3]WCK53971.1 hypothetical protein PP175_22040 [Aneurinibacillus sp. Ricciae_BoGa-3]